MGRGTSWRRQPRPVLLFGVLALALAAADGPAQGRRPQAPRRVARGGLQAGQPAPDFELPFLKFETREDGTIAGRATKETVELSSFRGKKAVVLFFSSYT